jgi:hypothetical protein
VGGVARSGCAGPLHRRLSDPGADGGGRIRGDRQGQGRTGERDVLGRADARRRRRTPDSYTIQANVKGGAAGFARGSARIRLDPEGDDTRLGYSVHANVGGKLAQVGSRLIDGTARKLADDFFAAFQREFGAGTALPSDVAEETAPREYQRGGNWKIWLVVFIALLLALMFAL